MSRKITVLFPQGKSGSYRVLRGGSGYNDPAVARVALRLWFTPDFRWLNLGFRVIMEIPCPER